MSFGAKLKEVRVRKRLTLRDCAAFLAMDASNLSKLERGVAPAPKDTALLTEWAAFFELDGPEGQEFLDLAALSRNQIPQDLAENEQLLAKLPAFFRAVRGQELEGESLTRFVEDIRALHAPDKHRQA